MDDYTVRLVRSTPTDPRLGRHVRHDSRSLLFRAPAADPASLSSVRHDSAIPILDQGQIGSCTGNAATAVLSYADLWGPATAPAVTSAASVAAAWARDVLSRTDAVADEAYAVGVYSEATALDPWAGTWEPDDTGSDGLSVAKVVQRRGLISGYQHATSLAAVLTALQKRAIITGTKWMGGMFDPLPSGELLPTGANQGGHEYVLDEVDVERRRIWMRNSWSESWGIGGRAWFSYAAYEELLLDDGDATVFLPNSSPAPTPTPAPPAPLSAFESFVALADPWAAARHSRCNRRMAEAYKAWRAAGSPGATK